ncbi:NADH-quinone oxidoreductase subunit M [Synechococcus sp. PCC 7336]|uniref:NADH-quinone oxidoreductase subunit M n=1 Tax=Synechococcus sp. PCC 7336 TaxID=195250 RepID=UPI00034581DC|nr:NADH-quinone oxidoreductase subunit M [Synechococcus sp. PCC 7336]
MLSSLIWIPVAGAIAIGLWPGEMANQRARQLALLFAALAFAMSLAIAAQFDLSSAGIQFEEKVTWIAPLGLNYRLGIDGLALPLLMLNTLLTGISVYSTKLSIPRPRLYYSLILLLAAVVAGAFTAQNLLLFFLFYEIELIPLYLLIAIWGGKRRGYAATKFLIYTALSGILVLTGFLGLVWLGHSPSFDLADARANALPAGLQILLLSSILLGFGIKTPVVPLHTWLPDAHVEASTPISVLLAGVLLKLGTYGLLRFGVQLFPDVWPAIAPWLAWIAVVCALYGAVIAITQTDMKKMVAYSSIAHMGFIVLAVAAANPLSLLGATFQMVSHGLISALLFLLVGVVYAKTGTRDLRVLQGLLNPKRGLPVMGSLMILAAMASSGIPGMSGFIAEFIVFRGSLPAFTLQTLLSMLGTGLTAVYFLILLNRAFFGRLSQQALRIPSVLWRDRIPPLILAVLIVILGLQPNWVAHCIEATTTAMTPPKAIATAPPFEPANLVLLNPSPSPTSFD